MKTTAMNSLASVAPDFSESEFHPACVAHEKRRRGTTAWWLALAVVVMGSAAVSRTPTVASEMAATRSTLHLALHGAYSGTYGASAACLPGGFSPTPWQQPFPPASVWEQAGARPF